MEFSVFRQVLIRALGHMQSIVEKRATLPICCSMSWMARALMSVSAPVGVSSEIDFGYPVGGRLRFFAGSVPDKEDAR